ncbi:MAG: hypothetical protein DMF26_03060 [Verrucomicrobia bacterium]|nr:MAG: hypothetical protein DMF26_03060 [Verrucomicrobiota bacterium]
MEAVVLIVTVLHHQRVGLPFQPVTRLVHHFGALVAQEVCDHRDQGEAFLLLVWHDERAISKVAQCGLRSRF